MLQTAKQEGIIEMLRKSYLDVRLMEKDKSDQITKLNNVINTQKWSLDRCQVIIHFQTKFRHYQLRSFPKSVVLYEITVF